MNRFNLSAWAIAHRSVVYYLMLAILVLGIGAYMQLGRNEDPAFTIKTMVVQARWPGATLDDTLHQVTERLERKLQETPHLDYLKSYTKAGESTVFVYLKGSTAPKTVTDTWYQVRKKVHDIELTLPQGVIGPVADDEFGDTYGIIYGFTADGFSNRELRDYVEDIRSRLLQVPDVAKVNLIGAQPERIYIEFSPQKLAGYGLTADTLTTALQAQNVVVPSGEIVTDQEGVKLQVSGALKSEKDILAVNFAVGDRIIRLADIAQVRREDANPPDPIFRINGKPGLGLGISMREGGDVLALGHNIEETIQELKKDLPVGIEPTMVADQPETVHHAIGEFMEALVEAIAIVLIVSVLSLGFRAGSVVAISIPLVLAAVFAAMMVLGIDLQRISLGALIIALGLLVDDAMITVETMVSRLERGDDKPTAAVFAYASTAMPRLTGTLVTVAGFVPVGFARSSAGEYTFSLFAVVALSLLASWVVSGLFAPVIGVALLAQPKHTHSEVLSAPMRLFKRFLLAAMRAKWITILVTAGLFAAALAGTRLIPEQFFPSSDRPELLVDLKLQDNASILATRDVVQQFDEIVAADPDVEHFSTYVGQGAIRFYLPLDVALANPFFAQSVIVTKGLKEREQVRARLEKALATRFPQVVARVNPLELGPPVGWPVKYRVDGPDPEQVRKIAMQLANVVGKTAGVRNVNFDWVEPSRVMRIHVDQDQARQLGLSSAVVATALNAVVSGTTVTQVRDDIYLIDVVTRAEQTQRTSLESLRSLQIPLPGGQVVPLRQIASFDYSQEYPIVWRRDRVPTLTVQADVMPGVLPSTAVKAIQPQLDTFAATLPSGYHIATGGSVEESGKSQASVMAVLPAMGLLVLTILMFQLQSFQRMFLVLSVAPLGMIGVVAALLLAQAPLGFVAILGVLALTGMIARNSVILIDQIETERGTGKHPWEAVVTATIHRTRPILLTAAAATLGMVPIAPTVFWGPMAFAIIGGLLVATVLTLIFLPALYVAWFRIREPGQASVAAETAETGNLVLQA
ncbi:efflux RND transporter permease subunit [Mesorhizobium sangaii]|uniref:Multidrug efflux pump subunit AcrB n=1 Tax=Mesorhizobium sangaii TaxID=505389 RepID=A0A841P243_9HYPH|nr:efflux RND transporter permease subunit [Mesorhizobium sangaii]MBB6409236.1 multidrug efflux pump subunit AcrB [Mesorhizobium sangaii]